MGDNYVHKRLEQEGIFVALFDKTPAEDIKSMDDYNIVVNKYKETFDTYNGNISVEDILILGGKAIGCFCKPKKKNLA